MPDPNRESLYVKRGSGIRTPCAENIRNKCREVEKCRTVPDLAGPGVFRPTPGFRSCLFPQSAYLYVCCGQPCSSYRPQDIPHNRWSLNMRRLMLSVTAVAALITSCHDTAAADREPVLRPRIIGRTPNGPITAYDDPKRLVTCYVMTTPMSTYIDCEPASLR
jgi:hypothetical protein